MSLDADYFQVTINDDNSVTIEPYLHSIVYQNTEEQSYYNPQERIFLEDKYGDPIVIKEEIKAI